MKRFLNHSEALALIRQGRFAELRAAYMTEHFRWGEAVHNRSDAAVGLLADRPHYLLNAYNLAHMMEVVRGICGHRSVTVTSWWRDPASNKAVGGASSSRHLIGEGVDFTVAGLTPQQVQRLLDPVWPGGLGYGGTFTHLDKRKKRVRFPY